MKRTRTYNLFLSKVIAVVIDKISPIRRRQRIYDEFISVTYESRDTLKSLISKLNMERRIKAETEKSYWRLASLSPDNAKFVFFYVVVFQWTAVITKCTKNYNARQPLYYGLLTKCEVKMAGYWPSSFLACL